MVVEGPLARPDNHAEERPNRAAADPPRVNPALCTCEDAARHLRPVRGPHGEPASPLRCGSSEGLEKSIRASTGAAQRAQPSSQGVVYGSAAQVRGRSKHLGHVGTAQAAGVPMGLLYTGATAARWPRPQSNEPNESNKQIKQTNQTNQTNDRSEPSKIGCKYCNLKVAYSM